MGRWTPPPTQDPLEQAQRETCEARELLQTASDENVRLRAQNTHLVGLLGRADQDKASAVAVVQEAMNEATTRSIGAIKRGDAWESIAWNLLNIGYRYITESQDRRDFHDQFERLQAHYLVRRQ